MKEAFKEAQYALEEDEVPVGAVIVADGRIIAKGHNQVERLRDPTAHAEMIAITAATHAMGGKYLENCTIYITVEPCLMCASALYWSKIQRIVYGASDNRYGFSLLCPVIFPAEVEIIKGVMQHECATLIKNFFKQKRK
jgi:tRNA(adenine34) deaminase